ncbi:MAG: hypothetical protein QGG40_17035, partial [Myxococcota bacterium]|nr:hypothetical protein [Myxococcota bacterium]
QLAAGAGTAATPTETESNTTPEEPPPPETEEVAEASGEAVTGEAEAPAPAVPETAASVGDGATSAMLWARALLAIAVPPEETDTEEAQEALAARRTAAREVPGWRAALLRAELFQSHGDLVRALDDFAAAVSSDDPRAVVAGELGRARLVHIGLPEGTEAVEIVLPPSSEAAGWAHRAAQVAGEQARGVVVAEAIALAVSLHHEGFEYGAAFEAATEIHEARVQAQDTGPLGHTGIVLSGAALAVGEIDKARAAARSAVEALSAAGLEQDASDASWLAGWSSYLLGDVEGLQASQGKVTGLRSDAMNALALILQGDGAGARSVTPTSGLTGRDAVRVWLEIARLGGPDGPAWAERAVTGAGQLGDPALKIRALLVSESVLRAVEGNGGSARTALLELAAEGTSGDAIRTEVAVRAYLETGKANIPTGDHLPHVASAWRGLSTSTEAMVPPEDSWAGPLAAWARGRSAAATNAAAQPGYIDGLGGVPLHRQGLLWTGSVLDGSEGVNIEKDLAILARSDSPDRIGAAILVHELGHRKAAFAGNIEDSVDLSLGLPVEQREAILGAAARVRAGLMNYYLSSSGYPAESITTLAKAEADAGKTNVPFGAIL